LSIEQLIDALTLWLKFLLFIFQLTKIALGHMDKFHLGQLTRDQGNKVCLD